MKKIIRSVMATAISFMLLLPISTKAISQYAYSGDQVKQFTQRASVYFVKDKQRVYFDYANASQKGQFGVLI